MKTSQRGGKVAITRITRFVPKDFNWKKIEKKEKHGWENKITNYLLVNCFEPFYEPFYLFRGFQEACKLCLNMQS